MKPLQKGVTASDLENCLYYVHLNGPEDEKLLESSSLQDPSPAGLSEDAVNAYVASGGTETVRRKPLVPARMLASDYKMGPPSNVNYHYQPPLHDHHQSPSQDPRYQPPLQDFNYLHDANYQPPLHDPKYQPSHENYRFGRKPGPPAIHSGAVGETFSQSVNSLNGPRPMRSRFFTTDGSLEQTDTSRHVADLSRRYEEPNLRPPELPPRAGRASATYSTDNVTEEADVASSAKVLRFRPGRKFSAQANCKRDEDRDMSLILIRRYDGLQSNVGNIFCTGERRNGPPGTVTAVRSPLKSSTEIYIQIFTPGYGRLVGPDSNVPLKSRESRLSYQLPDANGRSPITPGVEHDNVFQRQLRTVSARSRPRIPSQAYPRSQSTSDVRRFSEQANGGMQVDGLSPSSGPDTMQSSKKGYTFESPWHGLCEFHTGIAGRSLKCTHTSRASNNVSMSCVSVSELRFNLPSSSALGPPRTQLSTDSSRSSKRSSIFSHHRAKSALEVPSCSSYGSKIELEERMDLSLAKERAGGGFGGKHAKLGKLIVEHEGLKMLDLVVAANIALVCNLSNLYLPFPAFGVARLPTGYMLFCLVHKLLLFMIMSNTDWGVLQWWRVFENTP